MKRVIGILLLMAFLSACVAHRSRTAHTFFISDGVKASLLPPDSYNGELSLVQEISVSQGSTRQTLTGILKLSPTGMQVIILAGMARLVTVNYTSSGIDHEFSPLIPASNVQPEYIIFDVQLTYFPPEAINRALPDGMSLVVEGNKRTLYRGAQVIVEIIRDGETIEFRNLERSYSYRITHVEAP